MNEADPTVSDLDDVLAQAAAAATTVAHTDGPRRADWLLAVGERLVEASDELVDTARSETHLPEARLAGEIRRTRVQLELFDAVLRDGSYVEAVIDLPDPEAPLGPTPDLRRMKVPVGPVAVFAASNFPFAFSVAGNDTASALAAGCPVVVKAHPGHPRTARRTAEIVTAALADAGAPRGTFGLVEGLETGTALVQDPRVAAAGFTGSVSGGRALFDLANRRPNPIPFYGELGSTNPVIITRGAADERPVELARGLADSYTLGIGQFCTKPGIVLVPAGHPVIEHVAAAARTSPGGSLLNARIATGYREKLASLQQVDGGRVVVEGAADDAGADPSLLTVAVPDFLASADVLTTECFGPVTVLVAYADEAELAAALAAVPSSLTTTVHATDAETRDRAELVALLSARSGRLIWNGWPTGVAVTWAINHGGPYPATTIDASSVGATAIGRWLRPVCFQSVPHELLPPALKDDNPLEIMRRVDGRLTDRLLTRGSL